MSDKNKIKVLSDQYRQIKDTKKDATNTLNANIEVAKIHKSLLLANIIESRQVIEQFISESDQISQVYKHQYLTQSLRKLQNLSSLLPSSLYNLAIEQLSALITEEIKRALQLLSEHQQQNYKLIASETKNILNSIVDDRSTFKSQYSEITLQKLVNLDIMSIFLHRNHQIKSYYKCNNAFDIFSRNILCKVFNFSLIELNNFLKKFNQVYFLLTFDYQKPFQQYVSICCLLQLKCKVSNYIRKLSLKRVKQLQQIKIDLQSDNFKGQKQLNRRYTYRFSELAYFPIKTGTLNIFSKNIQIDRVLQKIAAFPVQKQRRQVLKAKVKFNVSFEALARQLDKMELRVKPKYHQVSQEYQKMQLFKCQWLCTKFENINDLIGHALPQFKNFSSIINKPNNRIFIQLFRLLAEKYTKMVYIFRRQKFLQKNAAHRQFINISRFIYSYHDIYYKSHTGKFEEEDVVCTVIIATDQQKLLFCSFVETEITFQTYYEVLKCCVTNIYLKKNSFNVCLDQFGMKKKIWWKNIYYIVLFFKRQYDARTYIGTEPQSFMLEYVINSFVLAYLELQSPIPKRQNFCKLVKDLASRVLNIL